MPKIYNRWMVLMSGLALLYTTQASLINPPPTPSNKAKIIDVVVGRPVMFFLTLAGVGIFIATLPFSAMENQVKQNADGLVVAPAKATFYRCLGCPVNFATQNFHPFYSTLLP